MASVIENISPWETDIVNHNFDTAYFEFQKQVKAGELSLEQEITLSLRCLLSVKFEICTTSFNEKHIPDIVLLVKFCCESLAKRWKVLSVNFIEIVYPICLKLLKWNYVDDAIIVGEFALEYIDVCGVGALLEKNYVLVEFISLFLIRTTTLELPTNVIHRIWDFIFSKQGLQIKMMSISKTFEYFLAFLNKTFKKNHNNDFALHLNQLNNLISRFDNAEGIFLECCSSVICKLYIFWNEKYKNLFLVYFNTFLRNHKESTAANFCKHIFQLTTGVLEDKCIADLVAETNYELKTLVEAKAPVLKHVILFASASLIKKRSWATGECQINANCLAELFELLVLLGQELENIDLSEFSYNKEKLLPKTDIISIVNLVYFVLHFAYVIDGVDLKAKNIYQRVLDAERMIMKYTLQSSELSEKQRQQIYSVGGGSCANICKSYMTAELYPECIEITLIALKCYSSLSAEELSKYSLQPYIKRLVLRLCNCYMHQKQYVNILKTTLAWTIIVPALSDIFMEEFCLLKVNFSSATVEKITTISGSTSLDLLKMVVSFWKHESLKTVDLCQLILLELEQYIKNNVTLAEPVLKLLEFIDTQNLPASKRAEYYILGAKILTNAADNLDKAIMILNTIKDLIFEIPADDEEEVEIFEYQKWRNIVLRGDLYYVKFRIELLSARHKNESEVTILKSLSKPSTVNQDTESYVADHFVSASYTFLMHEEQNKALFYAVNNWSKILENSSDEKKCPAALTLSHLRDAALVYRLQYNIREELRCWELLFSAAVSANNADLAVEAFSNLIILPWEYRPHWENIVKEMLPEVSDSRTLQYQLSVLENFLYRGFDQERFNTLMEIPASRVQESSMLAKYSFLCAKYLYYENKSSPFAMALRAYHIIMQQISKKKWTSFAECCELQALWFDITFFMISCETEKYSVLQAQKYLKEPFALVQKLGLPVRTCQLLNVSTRLDILTCRLEDCYLKLAYMCDVLNCESIANIGTFLDMKLKLAPVPSFSDLSPDFRSASTSTKNFELQSSPVVPHNLEYVAPEFINHDLTCVCNVCSTVGFLRVFCELKSLLSIYYGLVNDSYFGNVYFKGVLEMYDVVEKRLQNNYGRVISVQITELKISTMIHYANYLASKHDYKTAQKYNQEAKKYLKIACDPSLERKWEEQMWSLIAIMEYEKEKNASIKQKHPVIRPEKSQQVSDSCKTPARKVAFIPTSDVTSTKEVDVVLSGSVTPCPRRSRRLLKFNEFCTPLPPKKDNVVKKSQMSTPPDIVLQTPSTLEKRMKKLNIKSSQKSSNSLLPETIFEDTDIKTDLIREVSVKTYSRAKRGIVFENSRSRKVDVLRTVSISATDVSTTHSSRFPKESEENVNKISKVRGKQSRKSQKS